MRININWQLPILLSANKNLRIDEYSIPDHIDDVPGVYFFSRKFGLAFEPFYIGETLRLRSRLRDHLKDYRFRDVLRGQQLGPEVKRIAQGNKFFHYGYFVGKQRQDAKKCIGIVQAHMIEQALAEEAPLLNAQLTKFPTHSIEFSGPKIGRGDYFAKNFDVRAK